jgi:hypothetical protein
MTRIHVQSTAARFTIALIVVAAGFASAACSLLVDKNTAQCQGNSDCTRFGQAVCDLQTHLCVPAQADAGALDAAAPCQGPGGCYACQPTNETQVLISCTDSSCIPFDNSRLTNLNPDGTVKPLP